MKSILASVAIVAMIAAIGVSATITIQSYTESLNCNGGSNTYEVAQGACTKHGQGGNGFAGEFTCQSASDGQLCLDATVYTKYDCSSWTMKAAYVCGVCQADTIRGHGYHAIFDCNSNGTVVHNYKCNSDCSSCKKSKTANSPTTCVTGDNGNNWYNFNVVSCPSQIIKANLFGHAGGNYKCDSSNGPDLVNYYPSGKCQEGVRYTC